MMMTQQTRECQRDIYFTQQESDTVSMRTGSVNRRHSHDGTISSGSGSASGPGPINSNHFHPYRRQFSDIAGATAGCFQQSSFSCVQEVCSPDTHSHSSTSETPTAWEQYNGSIQSSYQDVPTVPAESSCFMSQSYPPYSSSSPLQQVQSRLYPNNDQSNGSKYSLQSPSTQSHQESTTQSLFPKPIYSYSILIFLALKNSKTGSLPVSEIYSFMTEHFPYFKSAPDGWKNSVRHNLSLNKCFEKVENKNGNSSRKGCLWALNPAKVEKMQEELHKWRRKDPVSVRRSMARPEDLDRLLGERPDRLRSLPPYSNPALLSRVAPTYGVASSSYTTAHLQPPRLPIQRPHYAHFQPQQPCYVPPAAAHPSNSFTLYPPCGRQPAAGIPSATGSLHSPMAGKIPPVNDALQAEYSSRSMQDLLFEGDASYDIDTLNPSLTDLQLQGNLWEELKEDSLVPDPHVTTTIPSTTSAQQDHHHMQTSCLQVMSPVDQTSEVITVGRQKAEYEDENTGRTFEQRGCLNGLHPVVYPGTESLTGYLTSCSASISLT